MREKFFGYIPYKDKDFVELWKEATFVFDANILLNFYRYSNDIKEQIFTSIEGLAERVWIPHQTAKEFFNNRVKVIIEQEEVYKSFKKNIKLSKQQDEINKLRHSSLSTKKKNMLCILDECENKLIEIIDKDKNDNESLINNDYILERILKIFDGKIGEEIDEEKNKEYTQIIDKRYEKNIPPGYKDKEKGDDRKYGDAINWLEIINFSKENHKHIIYITDDKKEDWFEKIGNKEIGPRKELLHEFFATTGKKVYLYDTEMFLKGFKKYISPQSIISQESLDEINYVNNHLKGDFIINDNLVEIKSKNSINDVTDFNWLEYEILAKKIFENKKYNKTLIEKILKNLTEKYRDIYENQDYLKSDKKMIVDEDVLKEFLKLYILELNEKNKN